MATERLPPGAPPVVSFAIQHKEPRPSSSSP